MRGIRKWALALAVTVGISSVAWAAPVYNDVPTWGQAAVQKVASQGLMVGDSTGKFSPDKVVTNFEVVDILAKLSGYKDPLIDSSISAQDKQFNENAYNQYKATLESASQRFKKWDSSKNQRIAYLLLKGILKESDLNNFVDTQGNVSPLKREEITTYLVRLLDKDQEALAQTPVTGFADDASISIKAKPYVTYLKKIGLVQGDTRNYFNPKTAVNRVTLAVFIANTLDYMEKSTSVVTPTNPTQTTEQSFIGTIKNIQHITRGFLVVTNALGQDLMYTISTDIQILQDGYRVTAEYLKEGMQVSMKVRQGNQSMQEVFSVQVLYDPTPTAPTAPTTPTTQNPVNTQKIQGTVDKVEQKGTDYYITIKQQVLLWGKVQEQSQTFKIVANAELKKDGKVIPLRTVNKGDIIEANVDMTQLYGGTILSREREIVGKIVDRQYVNGQQTISVEAEDKTVDEYNITKATQIYKKRYSKATWADLRIGDEVILTVDYKDIIELEAEGWRERVRGTVESILIAPMSKISLLDRDGRQTEYALLPTADISSYSGNTASIYDLRLGYEVELTLESEEIDSIYIRDENIEYQIQGTIEDLRDSGRTIRVRRDQGSSTVPADLSLFYVDSNTKIVYRGSSTITYSDLREGWHVLIYTKSDGKTIDVMHVLR